MNRRRKPTKPPAFVPLHAARRPESGDVVPRTVEQSEKHIEQAYERGVKPEVDALLDPIAGHRRRADTLDGMTNGTAVICGSCREVVDPNDSDVIVRVRWERIGPTEGDTPVEWRGGLGEHFHRRCAPPLGLKWREPRK